MINHDNLNTFNVDIETPHSTIADEQEYNLLISYFDADGHNYYTLDIIYIGLARKNVLKRKLDGKEIITIKIPNEYKLMHKQNKLYYILLRV